MATTRTGGFQIGFRRGWGDWQRDILRLIEFAVANDFAVLDFGPAPPAELQQVIDAGIKIGAVDLKDWKLMLAADPERRRSAVAGNLDYIRSVFPLGARTFLTALSPEDPSRTRADNFAAAVDSYCELISQINLPIRIVIEGWPGQAPYFGSIACTPVDCRAFFKAVADRVPGHLAKQIGINFDPSHLIRMGIDPSRFLREFSSRVYHAHGKDTDLLEPETYEHGNLQPATYAEPHGFGGHHWRYALPGHGDARWTELLAQLKQSGYSGPICIELEDEQFNGSEAGEKLGLTIARDFLATA